jgi:hypothetical protein
MFATMLQAKTPGAAKAIWDMLRSDRMQREAVAAIAKISLKKHPKHQEELLWLLEAIEALSVDRNDPIHSAYMFKIIGQSNFSVIPHPGGEARRVQRMKDKELLTEFRLYRDELHALRIFALGLEGQINFEIKEYQEFLRRPLPERPPVRSSVPTPNRAAKRREADAK